MDFDEYQRLALRTTNDSIPEQYRWANIGMGIAGECAELEECTVSRIIEEAGDVLWYVSDGASLAGIQMSEVVAVADYYYGTLTVSGGNACDYLKKVAFHGHELNSKQLMLCLSRVLYGVLLVLGVHGIDVSTVLEYNVEKLRNRYPEKFSEERSRNRETSNG